MQVFNYDYQIKLNQETNFKVSLMSCRLNEVHGDI